MGSGNFGAVVRLVALAAIGLAFWVLGKYATGMPDPKGLDAPAVEFSAARADATLARVLGPEIPHPVGSAENANVRARIQKEFASLGVKTSIYSGLGCMGRAKFGYFVCGTAKDILAEVQPGEGKAIILLAHYDSVPAGPGASDDESGVATILESVRAMKAAGIKSKHPILALITDGEEAGLLGAAAFADNPAFKARVGVIVNVEARGNQGPSLLFQTSPGDSKLIDLYTQRAASYETSSLFAVIYKALPNDTDLTVFLDKGLTGFNFAFSGNVAHYHTTLDRRENLSLSTLQEHGDNMLGTATSLMQTDFDSLKGGNDVYLSLYGKFLPRISAGMALPLALLSFVLLFLTGYLSRTRTNSIGQWAAAFAMPLVVILGCAAVGWLLFTITAMVSGQPDPSYAYPQFLRTALAFGILAIAVLATRMAQPRLATLAVWFYMSGLAVITAALLPGISPYFLFPALIAAVLLLIQSRLPGAWTGLAGEAAIFLAALGALMIWMSLAATSETVQGLVLHPLFTTAAASGAITLIPLAADKRLTRGAWITLFAGAGAVAVIVAVIAGMQPAFSAKAPQRLSITLIDNHIDNKDVWIAQTDAKLPASLRAAANFSATQVKAYTDAFGEDWAAPAGAPRFTPPSATITTTSEGKGRKTVLHLQGTPRADAMLVMVHDGGGLTGFEIGDFSFPVTEGVSSRHSTVIGIAGEKAGEQVLTLHFATNKPVTVVLGERHYGLPADGAKIAAARPAEAVASQDGDNVMTLKRLTLR